MIDRLFVYGTLMRAAATAAMGRDMRARLEAEGDWLGAATLSGRLYDLGAYPGLIRATPNGDRVHGEVYRLRDPRASFVWLDAYEGIPAGQTLSGHEYERVVDRAARPDGSSLDVWIYGLISAPDGARFVADGRWR